jgi:AcrR family transcriptional regulator
VSEEDVIDGRTARRDRNRVAVLDAVIELFAEDVLAPRPEQVAERSGVSLRSVYRYFSDPAELLRAAMARHLERVTPLLRIPDIGAGDLDDRIDRFVDARLRLHEAIAPVARAARAAAPRNEIIRAQYARTRSTLSAQVETHFGPELRAMPAPRRRAVVSGIDALSQLEGLDHLRLHQGHARPRAAEILRELVAILLTA